MKGIPYNVTVFATNGRGNGPNVSKITYAEEDGKNYHYIFTLQSFKYYSSTTSKRSNCGESECYTYDSELDCSQSSGGKRTHHLLHSQLLACLL